MVPPIRVEVHMLLSKRHNVMTRGAVLLTAALTLSAVTLKAGTDPVTVPERTAIRVTLDQSVATNRSKPGDHFVATVSEPVVINGKTVIPQGARAKGFTRTRGSAATTRNVTGRGSAAEPLGEPPLAPWPAVVPAR